MPSKHARDFSRFQKDLVELMGESGFANPEADVFSDMLYNIGLLREEKHDLADLRLLNTAFKELRYALKIFRPYRQVPKAAVFGSARTPRSHPSYKFAEKFGRQLAKKGWMIITGGASGIMEAAMLGAGAQNSFGLNIMLPFEQDANAVIKGNNKLIFFKYFFTRKLMFLKESEATVLFPGGFGTFDEGFESLTLVQTGKAKPRPLVLIDTPGSSFWRSTVRLLKRNMEGDKLISPGDLGILTTHHQDTDKAVEEIARFYSNYHSSRFFNTGYLIRVKKPVSAEQLDALNEEFKDMMKGKMEILTSIADDDNKDPFLTRLFFQFNRSSYSRLRLLIDRLNA